MLLLRNKDQQLTEQYVVTPSCLWNVGCQDVSVLMFLTGACAKLKREHMKRIRDWISGPFDSVSPQLDGMEGGWHGSAS